jgi:hypothetical protein
MGYGVIEEEAVVVGRVVGKRGVVVEVENVAPSRLFQRKSIQLYS